MSAKTCTRCRLLLDIVMFWPDAVEHAGHDGVRPMCKTCQVDYERERRAKQTPVHMAARIRLNEKSKAWIAKNRDRYLARQKARNIRVREKRRAERIEQERPAS